MLPRRPKSTVLNSQGFQRIYSNKGNLPLINMLSNDCKRLLDIGAADGRQHAQNAGTPQSFSLSA